MKLKLPVLVTALIASSGSAAFAEGEVNLYSSRHYDTDELLYSEFTEQTGITVNRIEGKADELIARMKAEGLNSPADVLIRWILLALSVQKTLVFYNRPTARS